MSVTITRSRYQLAFKPVLSCSILGQKPTPTLHWQNQDAATPRPFRMRVPNDYFREVQSFASFGFPFPRLLMGIFCKADVHINDCYIVILPQGNICFHGKIQVTEGPGRSALSWQGLCCFLTSVSASAAPFLLYPELYTRITFGSLSESRRERQLIQSLLKRIAKRRA